jgi:hypothetical protein
VQVAAEWDSRRFAGLFAGAGIGALNVIGAVCSATVGLLDIAICIALRGRIQERGTGHVELLIRIADSGLVRRRFLLLAGDRGQKDEGPGQYGQRSW